MKKVIIAGSRNFIGYGYVESILTTLLPNTLQVEVVCGMCEGVDGLGNRWAENNRIKVHRMPADWAKHGRAAGPIRNSAMADFADELIAFWDGKTENSGTIDMITKMRSKKKPVTVIHLKSGDIQTFNHNP